MKVRIEMEVPNDMDPSTLLDLMQEAALAYASDFGEEDPEGNVEVDEEAVKDTVSVEVLRS